MPRPGSKNLATMSPEKKREVQRKGGLTKSQKKSMTSAINFNSAKCKNCKLTCPYKQENLDKDPEHKCTIPRERYYAKFVNNTQIVNSKALELKHSKIITEVENIIENTRLFLKEGIHDPDTVKRYMEQLAFLSKLITDNKIHFNSPDEVGFKKDDSILTDTKMFINLVYSVINSELDLDTAQKIIGKIHEKTKDLVNNEEEDGKGSK